MQRCSRCFSLLLGVAGRWRSIRLALTRRADLHAVQQLTSEDAPLLESLGLSCSRLVDEAEVDDEAIYSFQLAEAPTLRRLGYSGSYESLPKNVNWSNLVFLKLHLWTDSEINTPTPIIPSPFHFLRDAAGLEVLDLSISRYETRFDPIDPIHLPQLTKLRISLHGLNEQEDISGTIRQFDMPQLRTLDFLLAAATKLTDVVAPLPRLTSLSISLQLYPSMDLAAGLALIPHLERLRILGEPVLSGAPDNEAMETDSLFLERFIPRTDAGADAPAPLCPALHTFEYLFVNQVTDALVVRFLKSRTSPLPAPDPGITVARLKRFYFYPFREAQLDITAALASALADGLVMGLGHRQSSRASYSVLEGTEHDPARSKNGVGHEWLQHEEFNEDFRLVGGWVAGL
ncbi:F-box domain-containing protein [Mycena kentingensis (nom. inval.)]|nr:F-box domain-containing protein [Mycena kentingensis (nom. inval.)]